MEYGLPNSVEIDGKKYEIRTDFRVILDIFEAISDPEITPQERAYVILNMFYVAPEEIMNPQKALDECFRFIDRGNEPSAKKNQPQLVDWQKDYQYIIAPVNRVLGYEARSVGYDFETNTGGLHWWTFLSAYMEIGNDCMLAQIVGIRDKQAHGKKLSKEEKQWLKRNADIVALPRRYSESEQEIIAQWTTKG